MPKVRNLLGRGNAKLGQEGIHTFSIPPVTTCPGRSPICEMYCYARMGRFRTGAMRARLAANQQAANEPDFVERVVAEIRRRCIHVLRIHVAGDFFSSAYAMKWVEIARHAQHTKFYTYSRSWRQAEIATALETFAVLPNTRLWYSVDRQTDLPDVVPEGVRLAYLEDDPDLPLPPGIDLVFRVRKVRSCQPTLFPLAMVCPTERPDGPNTDCGQCGRCWR